MIEGVEYGIKTLGEFSSYRLSTEAGVWIHLFGQFLSPGRAYPALFHAGRQHSWAVKVFSPFSQVVSLRAEKCQS